MVEVVKDSILATIGDAGEDDGTSTVIVRMDQASHNPSDTAISVADAPLPEQLWLLLIGKSHLGHHANQDPRKSCSTQTDAAAARIRE